jgi:hypothetical protein
VSQPRVTVSEARRTSGIQRKGNVPRWKPLPNGIGEDKVDWEELVHAIVKSRLYRHVGCFCYL